VVGEKAYRLLGRDREKQSHRLTGSTTRPCLRHRSVSPGPGAAPWILRATQDYPESERWRIKHDELDSSAGETNGRRSEHQARHARHLGPQEFFLVLLLLLAVDT
jgi:hypothetical protein